MNKEQKTEKQKDKKLQTTMKMMKKRGRKSIEKVRKLKKRGRYVKVSEYREKKEERQ